MNIDFNVLIIDDDTDYSDYAKSQLEDFISENNLLPNIITKSKFDKSNCEGIGNRFDLIIVDYNLPNNTYGTEFIENIRSYSLLPDIVFYSSTSSIEEIIQTENNNKRVPLINLLQKGIYYSNSEKMVDIAKQVILKIIKREEKINGFRGLVLSNVSEFESIVNTILLSLLTSLPDNKRDDLISYVQNELRDVANTNAKKISEFNANLDLEALFDCKNRCLDHYRRTKIMNHFLKELGCKTIVFQDYVDEVLQLRNSLGHVSYSQKDDAEFYSFVFKEEVVHLTPKYCSDKREMLLRWKNKFELILDELKGNAKNLNTQKWTK